MMIQEGGSFREVVLRAGPNVAPTVLAGFALTVIIYTGAIDLSIGSIIVVAGTVFGVLSAQESGPIVAFVGCLITTCVLCSFNGWLIHRLAIPAIIVTLGGLTFYRGIALILADIGMENFSGFISITNESYQWPGKKLAGFILLFGTLTALVLEWYSRTIRHFLALGSSEEACQILGLNPGAILQKAFFVSGCFLSAAALVYVTRLQTIEPSRMARGFELEVIGAVVVGGTNIFGGEGSFIGTLLGAFFLYFVREMLVYAGISAYFQDVVTGCIIIGIIGIDCRLHKRRKRMEELA